MFKVIKNQIQVGERYKRILIIIVRNNVKKYHKLIINGYI